MRSPLALFRKAGWAVVDQATSAVSNVLLSVMVAREVDAIGFGAFSIAFVIFGVGISIMRAIAGQPLQINYAARAPEEFTTAAARAVGFSLVTSCFGGLACVLAGLLFGGELQGALVALGICLPMLLAQDTCRMALFAKERADQATLIDALWAVVQTALLVAMTLAGVRQVWALVLAWGVGGAISALVGFRLLRVRPVLRKPLTWFTEQKSLTGYLFAEYFLGLGSAQLGTLMAGAIATPRAVGSLRAAQVLLGPLNTIGSAAFAFMVPQVARRAEAGKAALIRIGHLLMAGMSGLSLVYVIVLLLIPDWLGVQLFGDSWAGAASVLLAMGVNSVLASTAAGPAIVLYGTGHANLTFRINILKAPLLLISIPLATWLYGAPGAAWALAACEGAVMPLWYFAFRKAATQGRAATLTSREVET